MASIRIGISGWTYPGWRGDFYPAGLVHRRELAYAAERLGTIEINGSFYSLQQPSSYTSWRQQTPDEFVFAVKGGRFITHIKRLADVETPLANFLASGVLALGAKLGPILWQLPANVRLDPSRLETFLDLLPGTTAEAAAHAAQHDDKVTADKALVVAGVDQPLRHALEVRHPSFATDQATDIMRRHGVACVFADSGGKWPAIDTVTADFVYLRLHGAEELYASGYTGAVLDHWAGRIRGWSQAGLDVYAYFDNDAKVCAPYDAMSLMRKLHL
ncbi:MAG: DUF72 domain-containing protein [Nocardioidaceae bacterium]